MKGLILNSTGLFPFKVLFKKSMPVLSGGITKSMNRDCSVPHWIPLMWDVPNSARGLRMADYHSAVKRKKVIIWMVINSGESLAPDNAFWAAQTAGMVALLLKDKAVAVGSFLAEYEQKNWVKVSQQTKFGFCYCLPPPHICSHRSSGQHTALLQVKWPWKFCCADTSCLLRLCLVLSLALCPVSQPRRWVR